MNSSAGNVWVGALTRNGPGLRRRGPRAGSTSNGQGPGLSAADTIADSEDWTLQPGTTLGATAPVKRRVFIQGLHKDAPAATPTLDKGGRTRIDPSGRGIRANEGGCGTRLGSGGPAQQAAGRDSSDRIPTPHQPWHGCDSDGQLASTVWSPRTGDQQREVRLTPRGRWKSNPTLGRNYLGAPQDGSASGP